MGVAEGGDEEKWQPWCHAAFLLGTIHPVFSGALEWSTYVGHASHAAEGVDVQ